LKKVLKNKLEKKWKIKRKSFTYSACVVQLAACFLFLGLGLLNRAEPKVPRFSLRLPAWAAQRRSSPAAEPSNAAAALPPFYR
jgi:hypothetical protein